MLGAGNRQRATSATMQSPSFAGTPLASPSVASPFAFTVNITMTRPWPLAFFRYRV